MMGSETFHTFYYRPIASSGGVFVDVKVTFVVTADERGGWTLVRAVLNDHDVEASHPIVEVIHDWACEHGVCVEIDDRMKHGNGAVAHSNNSQH